MNQEKEADFAMSVGTSLISVGTVARIPLVNGRAEERKGDERREGVAVPYLAV